MFYIVHHIVYVLLCGKRASWTFCWITHFVFHIIKNISLGL